MASLYDLSVPIYRRVLTSTIAVMEKGAIYFAEQAIDPEDIIDMRLAPDMAAFPFQVNSVRHHSLGAAKGLLVGEFSAPPDIPELDYQGLLKLLTDALAEFDTLDADVLNTDALNAVEGRAMYFRMGDFEIPFTSENFLTSFSLPNLYFHATTLYDMLRIKGVPLGKMDFLGKMEVGLPSS